MYLRQLMIRTIWIVLSLSPRQPIFLAILSVLSKTGVFVAEAPGSSAYPGDLFVTAAETLLPLRRAS
jgi:hypothetical protein